MKATISTLSMALLLSACASQPDYQLSGTTAAIRDMQVLDPQAAERNEGTVRELDGPYAEQVMTNARSSQAEASSARQISTQQSGKSARQ